MEHIERIASIEKQARAVNLTLGSLCRKAGVSKNTINKWKLGITRSPTMYAYKTAMDALDKALSDERQRLGRIIAETEHEVAA